MLINFSESLKGLDGQEIMVEELGAKGNGVPVKKPLDLRTVCVNALLGQYTDANGRPENVAGTEKMKRYILAKRLYSGGEVVVTAEEITLLKLLIEKGYNTLVVGLTNEMLERE